MRIRSELCAVTVKRIGNVTRWSH